MSEISNRTNIISIDEVNPVTEVQTLMAKLGDTTQYQSFTLALSNMQSLIPNDILKVINAKSTELNFTSSKTTVKGPNLLRASFQSGFPRNLKILASGKIDPLIARKASFLSVLDNMNFKISEPYFAKTNILAVVKANDKKTLNKEMKTIMHKLEVEHTKVFVNNLAKACANASFKIGFNDIEIKKFHGKLEVIATNSIGQHLNSEISVDTKTNTVNANTETLGITDHSCTRIILDFNNELRKMGIKIGKENTISTGGIPQMTYSKLILQMDREPKRKKKEFERLIRLNIKSKQKQQN